jgi:death-on-curing family protein
VVLKGNNLGESKGSIVIYKLKGGKTALEVKLEKETVWLTQKQLADLFGVEIHTINYHIKEIFGAKELKENLTIRNFRIVQKEGDRVVEREIIYYNLDLIISVGYRVNSSRSTQFRIWATKVLKDYLIEGYALNQKRLAELETNKIKELQETIGFIAAKSTYHELAGQSQELIHILNEYSNTLTLLYQYDINTLTLNQKKKPRYTISYESAKSFIEEVKSRLHAKGEATHLFGQEIDHKFNSIMGTIYQTFGGHELYPSLEEKAANILYFVIKDHPFADGNKRIGALLFIYFLEKNKYLLKISGERKITDTTLTALALLMAISNPKEKDTMIKIITNLIR